MPKLEVSNKLYRIRNKKGQFWQTGVVDWVNGTGSNWKSLTGALSQFKYASSSKWRQTRFCKKDFEPVIVEYELIETAVYDEYKNKKDTVTTNKKIEEDEDITDI